MDVFSRTFLPAAAETGVTNPIASRHLPILRSCVAAGDATILVARCVRPEQPAQSYLLLLTARRMVVTQQTRVLHRLRLHLNAELRHLNNVTWNPDPRTSAIELAATAVDGVRERFVIRADRPSRMWQLDALFHHVFRPKMTSPGVRKAANARPAGGSVPVVGRDTRAVPPMRTVSTPVPTGAARAPRFRPAIAV